ncbi:MAG: lasso peptide biosynthesis B2 protein [Chloroflexota bacterium]
MWNSWKHRLQIARGLSASDWLALAEAWWKLLGYFLALRRKSFESLVAQNSILRNAPPSLPAARRLRQLVIYASRLHLLPMTCLSQSLALRDMLGKRGISSEIRIGAKKAARGIHAHAWVEIEGQTIGEPEDISDRFNVLDSVEPTTFR